jgi:hypothetical protein
MGDQGPGGRKDRLNRNDYDPVEFSKEEASERLEIIGVVKGIMRPKR